MASYLHIINPFPTKVGSEERQIHDITIKSIIDAKQKSQIQVDLCYTKYDHEEIEINSEFKLADFLIEHQINLGKLNEQRKLPRLKDILQAIPNHSESDYIIFSNMDIGLMPNFYTYIDEQINKGFDALIINRRRVSKKFQSGYSINEIVSEVGKTHAGYDTFIFKKSFMSEFILGDTFVGIPNTGNDLFYNLFCLAQNPLLLTDKHLTFHIGMELVKDWGDKKIAKHNYDEFIKTVKRLEPKIDISKFPGSHLPFIKRHLKWLFNPTIHYPSIALCDLKQLGKKRKSPVNQIDNYKHQNYAEWLIDKIGLNE